MRGRRYIAKRKLAPDTLYSSQLVQKLINRIMLEGQKRVAESIVYGAFKLVEQKTKKPPLDVLTKAMENVSPLLEVRSRRIGGANYQVPMEVRPERREALAMRWVLEAARAKKGKPMEARLADEILDAYNATGTAMKKREDMHKMAEANRAFAHFARF